MLGTAGPPRQSTRGLRGVSMPVLLLLACSGAVRRCRADGLSAGRRRDRRRGRLPAGAGGRRRETPASWRCGATAGPRRPATPGPSSRPRPTSGASASTPPGEAIEPTPFVDHRRARFQDQPQVAWNGSEWLVVFKTGPERHRLLLSAGARRGAGIGGGTGSRCGADPDLQQLDRGLGPGQRRRRLGRRLLRQRRQRRPDGHPHRQRRESSISHRCRSSLPIWFRPRPSSSPPRAASTS